jgi:hypothetical protein
MREGKLKKAVAKSVPQLDAQEKELSACFFAIAWIQHILYEGDYTDEELSDLFWEAKSKIRTIKKELYASMDLLIDGLREED